MRIAAIVALFVVLFAAGLVSVVAPASGQTIPPTETPTATPKCQGDCSIAPTPRPTASVSPTPDPGCTDDCGPIPTPRPDAGTPQPTSTPNPACPANDCFPFPTPRPTYAPGATIEPAGPNDGIGFWHYSFAPIVGRSR